MKSIILLLGITILLYSCQTNNTEDQYTEDDYIDVDTTAYYSETEDVNYEYEDTPLTNEEYAYPKLDYTNEPIAKTSSSEQKGLEKPKKIKNYSTKSKIYLDNPSFDIGDAAHSTAPFFWTNSCSFPYESPPDVHLSEKGIFGVKNKSKHGNQFLGLVTRVNNTYEAIFQKLMFPLKKDEKYTFSLYLAMSNSLHSFSKESMQEETFTVPSVLRVWGGEYECDQSYLIYESPTINQESWKKYKIAFTAQKDIKYIILEAFYTDANVPKNGNILIDNISPIIRK